MNSKINLHIGFWRLTITLILLALSIIRCNDKNIITLKQETSTISGKIEDFDGVFKSGKLSFFDAISRTVQSEIFEIDSTGCFTVSFTLSHPIYNNPLLELQRHVFTLFLEPGKDLNITIAGDKISFIGESGLANIQINLIEDSINSKFKEEIKKCDFLHTTNIGYRDYIKEQIDLSNKILKYIEEFEKTHRLNKQVLNAVRKDAYYAPARSWICFRYDYSGGSIKKRDTLFKNFYEDLFKAYPVNDYDAVVSREYTDYISNIQSILAPNEPCDTLNRLYENSNSFTDEELILIRRANSGDTTVFGSEEFKRFYNNENRKKMIEIVQRAKVNKLLLSGSTLPRGIGRDLIISQGICNNYFIKNYINPTDNEWGIIEGLIGNRFILEYLLDLNNKIATTLNENNYLQQPSETVKKLAAELNKEIFEKYKSKVIYIDFWATWCSPCRREIPYLKVLVEQFKNKDVVFLSLCCKSTKQNWEKAIALENIPGEHYFVDDVNYDVISSFYSVDAFPTYILIDKNGEIKNLSAPRPSSNNVIIEEIQALLDYPNKQ